MPPKKTVSLTGIQKKKTGEADFIVDTYFGYFFNLYSMKHR